jgi:hypothetical protein
VARLPASARETVSESEGWNVTEAKTHRPAVRPCGAATRHGAPCRREALPDSEQCDVHDPRTAEKHRAASRAGGWGRAGGGGPLDVSGLDLNTLDGLRGLLARALAKLAELRFNEKTASAIGGLAQQLRAILQDADLERRLAALEKSADTPARSAGEPWTQ